MPSTSAAPVYRGETRTIDQLCLSPLNVRTHEAAISGTAIAAMEALLLSQGQLEPILVHPLKGNTRKWGAHAGGRRYRAFKNLVATGVLPPDFPIKVEIKEGLSDAQLLAESMVENIGRRDLEDYETFAGVRRMHKLGQTVDQIAVALGQEPDAIARWLRLGNLAEPIFHALAAGRITTEQARAFGATEDVAVQLAAWERLSAGINPRTEPVSIRAALGIGDRELGKLLTFVGEDAYLAAGGRLEPDLFATGDDRFGRIVDAGKLRELAEVRLAALRGEYRHRTGRPDLRFVAHPPKNDMDTIDHQLRVTPGGTGEWINLPEGDIVAHLYVDHAGKPAVGWWWASRKAKFADRRGDRAAAQASPRAVDAVVKAEGLKPAAAIGAQFDGARQVADAAIREEEGLSAEGVDIFRSVRRTILRGLLVDDAEAGGDAGTDYLVWTQLRLAMDMDARSTKLGVGNKAGAPADPEVANEHVRAMPGHTRWREALDELRGQSFMAAEDYGEAFLDYRASNPRVKRLAAAAVTGWSLERSLAADGYVVPVHDTLAGALGIDRWNHDERVRRYWTPTEELLRRIPTRQAVAIAEPFVEPDSFGAWAKAKAADIVRRLVQLVTGEQVRGARPDLAAAAATWVHPLLRFHPAEPLTDNDDAAALPTEQVAA